MSKQESCNEAMGPRLQALRERVKWTPQQAAAAAGTSLPAILNMEASSADGGLFSLQWAYSGPRYLRALGAQYAGVRQRAHDALAARDRMQLNERSPGPDVGDFAREYCPELMEDWHTAAVRSEAQTAATTDLLEAVRAYANLEIPFAPDADVRECGDAAMDDPPPELPDGIRVLDASHAYVRVAGRNGCYETRFSVRADEVPRLRYALARLEWEQRQRARTSRLSAVRQAEEAVSQAHAVEYARRQDHAKAKADYDAALTASREAEAALEAARKGAGV